MAGVTMLDNLVRTITIDDLGDFMAGWRETPFAWPDNNCTHFPAAWVEHIEGGALAVPAPASKWAALRRVALAGGMVRAISAVLRREPMDDLADVCVGDVVLFGRGVIVPGLIGVVGVAISDGPDADAVVVGGAVGSLHPVSLAQAAWRVRPWIWRGRP